MLFTNLKRSVSAPYVAAVLLVAFPMLLCHSAHGAPAAKKPAGGALGHGPLKGGEGQLGDTYSTTGNFDGWNVTFISAAYSIDPHRGEFPNYVDKGQKFLVIHLRIKNNSAADKDASAWSVPFTIVDEAGNSIDDQQPCVRASDGKVIDMTVKPGFGVDDLTESIKLKNDAKVVKIVANVGRVGTTEKVIRFAIDGKTNTIAPLSAPYADPADASGATALPDFPGKVGAAYPMLGIAVTVDSFAFADKFGAEPLPDGKRFLVISAKLKNLSTDPIELSGTGGYRNGFLAEIVDSDGEDVPQDASSLYKKASREEAVDDGKSIAPGQEYAVRLLTIAPKDGALKKITLRFAEGASHGVTYDLAALK